MFGYFVGVELFFEYGLCDDDFECNEAVVNGEADLIMIGGNVMIIECCCELVL